MRLRPSARLQKYLGKELIADPNLAVLEYVKNAYDAGATTVTLDFRLKVAPTRLVIADNGVGMDEAAFRANWLQPGFSEKSPDYDGPLLASTRNRDAAKRMRGRQPAGEKGLGRLSAGRLGSQLEVWTRPLRREKWLHVTFDWSRFEDMTVPLDTIRIPFEFAADLPEEYPNFQTGTIIVITDLQQDWGGSVPGRPAAGRKKTRLGRLRQDLEFFLRPLSSAMSLTLHSDTYINPSDIGEITPASAREDSADYVYNFTLDMDEADYVIVTRELRRSKEAAAESAQPRVQQLPTLTVNKDVARQDERSEELRCGPFKGSFVYTPPPKRRRAKTVDKVGYGVLLYRDDILVEPYGMPGDDWVGAEARKASRQGHAGIQPALLSGVVNITRRDNPRLEDMSNRLGLLDNEASDDFFSHVRAEFAYFESLIYEEVVKTRWRSIGTKAAMRAGEVAELAQVRLRALVHRAGQPLQSLGFDTLRLETVAKRAGVPEDVRDDLLDIAQRIDTHTEYLSGIISQVSDLRPLDFSEVNVDDLIEQVIGAMTPAADLAGVRLSQASRAGEPVIICEPLIHEALCELVSNAIDAPRPSGRTPHVLIAASVESGSVVRIEVRDDGTGMEASPGTDLSLIPSTKARPAGGLVTAELATTASRGHVALAATGVDGTVFHMRLPRGVAAVTR